MTLFDTYIIVDWSARSKPSPAKPTKDAIWWATVEGTAAPKTFYERTRASAKAALLDYITEQTRQNRRVLIGFDFPFGYPVGTAAKICGTSSAMALWDWISDRITDDAQNANNRYAVASEMNRAYAGVGPAWGRPASWQHPEIPTRSKTRTTKTHTELRLVEKHAKTAKTVWQLAYAGSVGSQILVGLPVVRDLQQHIPNAAIWPIQTGLDVPDAQVVFAEIYPSLLQSAAHTAKSYLPLDESQVRVNAQVFAKLDAGEQLAPLFQGAAYLTAQQRQIIETEEAWILGLGHEHALRAAA